MFGSQPHILQRLQDTGVAPGLSLYQQQVKAADGLLTGLGWAVLPHHHNQAATVHWSADQVRRQPLPVAEDEEGQV